MSAAGTSEPWRANGWRWCKFSLVGATGIVVQLGALTLLTASGMEYLLATVLAVEAAVLHNFAWHQNFTWSDREGRPAGRLARFHLTNGAISLLGNLAMMRLLVGHFALPALPANVISIAVCALANFAAADRLVFLAKRTSGGAPHTFTAAEAAIPSGLGSACLKACPDTNLGHTRIRTWGMP